MSKGIIIACFSCSGKTSFVLKNYKRLNIQDHDLYDYKFSGQGKIRPDWIKLYMDHLDWSRNKYDYTLINAVPEILELLPKTTPIVYPLRSLRHEYLGRSVSRSLSMTFCQTLNDEWDSWIDACENSRFEWRYQLESNEYFGKFWEVYEKVSGMGN